MNTHWFFLLSITTTHKYISHISLNLCCIHNWFRWAIYQAISSCRNQSRYAPSQWETLLHCNYISHWLGTYLDWSLQQKNMIIFISLCFWTLNRAKTAIITWLFISNNCYVYHRFSPVGCDNVTHIKCHYFCLKTCSNTQCIVAIGHDPSLYLWKKSGS